MKALFGPPLIKKSQIPSIYLRKTGTLPDKTVAELIRTTTFVSILYNSWRRYQLQLYEKT